MFSRVVGPATNALSKGKGYISPFAWSWNYKPDPETEPWLKTNWKEASSSSLSTLSLHFRCDILSLKSDAASILLSNATAGLVDRRSELKWTALRCLPCRSRVSCCLLLLTPALTLRYRLLSPAVVVVLLIFIYIFCLIRIELLSSITSFSCLLLVVLRFFRF